MNSFSFVNGTRIFYGVDSVDNLPTEIEVLGPRILLHYGQSSIKKNGIYDTVMNILKELEVEVFELGGVQPNPTIDLVFEGIKLCQEHDITGILAVGGGSVIDSAKAIGAGIYMDNIEEAFMKRLPVEKMLPVGCILTIPAAGSESSRGSVITVANGKHKRSIGGEKMYPEFAIINPAYFITLNKFQTACGISDIYSHLLERYFTNTTHVSYTDSLLEASMRTLMEESLVLMEDLSNVDARAEIGFVGNLAHNGLLGSGREEDWASHSIEHELSAKYGMVHGAGLAIVFPAWMKHVWKENPDRFIRFATEVMGVDEGGTQEEIIMEGISRFEDFMKALDLPVRLHEAGIFIENPTEIVENCFYERPEFFGSFKKIYKEDMSAILELAQ